MKILFISNYSELYGANRSMITILEYLQERGYDIKLILPYKGLICKELERKNIDFQVIRMFTQMYYYKPKLKYLALPLLIFLTYCRLRTLKKLARKYNPDLIYSNTSAEMVGIKIAKAIKVKHISHIREFMDLDHGAKYLWGNVAKKKYINQSDGVIYVSKAVAEHVNIGEPLKEWQRVIYNGVDFCDDPFSTKKIKDEINFGMVGILDPEKGQDIAICNMPKILEIYPHAKLHIWGDKEGKYKQTLHSLVKKMGITSHVIFHGFEKKTNIIYQDMDILLMCSRCEGFGRVTVEAMQRGIPVIGYNRGGTSELIKNGINGYLFDNQEDFVRGIRKILSSESFYNQIRHQAFVDSRANYSKELYCHNVESFLIYIMNRE